MASAAQYDERYLRGIEFFNNCDYFEAHEVWEELWADYQGPLRRFYQGLIQLAVCLHHFGNGNLRGARKLYYGCRGYLEGFAPWEQGIRVDRLLSNLEDCCREILDENADLSQVTLCPDRLPEIHLQDGPDNEGRPA